MVFRTFLLGILASAAALAQFNTFPKASYFREVFRKPDTKVELAPPARLQDFVVTGEACDAKLFAADVKPEQRRCIKLSLKNYLDLVMTNNTGIQVSLLNVETAKNNVLSKYSSWDPSVTVGFTPSFGRTDKLLNNPDQSHTFSESWPVTLSFKQTLSTGQKIDFGGGGSKGDKSNEFASYSTDFSAGITQPLLKGRGTFITRISLVKEQNNYRNSENTLRQNLITSINSAEKAYWDLVLAHMTLDASIRSRNLQNENWLYVQRQLNAGAISIFETFGAESSLASREVAVSTARFSVRTAEHALRRQISADLDLNIAALPIDLTESPDLSASEMLIPDREEAVSRALISHPSIRKQLITLENNDLDLVSARNGILPDLNLTAGYSIKGAGGVWQPTAMSKYADYPMAWGGAGDSWSQLFHGRNPTYKVGLSLTLPLRSRSAAVTLANALITKRSSTLDLRGAQQDLRLNVMNALTSLEGAQESLKLSEKTLEITKKDSDGKRLQYDLGIVQQIEVLRANNELAVAEQNVVEAKVALRRALQALQVATGELLDKRGIVVQVPPMPKP